jgi:signal transduction histidine kinase/CheY-like chemotaxis protein/HPt (histidine-containing phosphotransfer) domain-containing protein
VPSVPGRVLRLFYRHSVLVLTLLLAVGGGVTFWHLATLSRRLMQTSALQGTMLQSDSLAEVRTFYTQDVVERVRAQGIEVSHDYLRDPSAIPLPATFSIELGRRIGGHGTGMQVRLYSDYPFPFRRDGGARDPFEREALTALRQDPGRPFYRFEPFEGRPSLRYAVADRMRASCVACHNTRADSPKKDWKEGDVRGVLEVIRPLDRVEAETRSGLRQSFVLLTFISGLAASGLALVIGKLRRTSDELEERVEKRTSELALANRELKDEVTQRRKVEGELAVARDAALESARAKSEFLANISHEIRTPLNGVIGMTGLLARTELSPEQRDFARTIESCGETLLALVNDVLDLSKIEAGKLVLEETDFDLRETVESALEPLLARARDKKVELASLVYQDVATAVRGDGRRLRQVITNLVGNGVKFTERGEVVVRVTRESDEPTRQVVKISVVDTGIGIPHEAQSRLFQAFSQADGSTTRKYGGTGLGLVISKQIVEAMGGEIGMQSEPGRGSTFWCTVPLEKRAPVASRPAELAGVPVLIVDDNETNRTILHHQLNAWGMKDDSAADAEEALLRLRRRAASGKPFQIAVLDMQMPGMDGLGLARVIRADAALAGLRLVMLSSIGQHLDPVLLSELGIAACLMKPVKQSPLFDCLSDVMAGRTAPGERRGSASSLRRPSEMHGRILVAEDNPINREVATAMLDELGYDWDVAGTGAEALQSLSRRDYSAVLMDCQMPELDGYEAARELRRREGQGRRTPVIAMTAHALAGDRERCLEAGMDDYLTKPLYLDQLRQRLERWAGTSAPSRSPSAEPPPSAPSSAAAEPSVAPPADLDRLRAVCRGPEDVKRMSAMFFTQARETMAGLENAVPAQAGDDVRRLAHALAGASANLGFGPLSAALRALERAGREGQWENRSTLLEAARREVESLRRFLEEHLAADGLGGSVGGG